MTHAAFKGLLFLGAGSVIHAVHTNDIREMGGLSQKMKITSLTFIIASLSIAGIFPLSGFWSKDEIVASTVHHPVFLVVTLLIAFMTAFYMFRLCFLTFFGEPRDQHRFDHAHESPRVMTWPLIVLAFSSIFAGWVGIPWLHHGYTWFLYQGNPPEHTPSWALMIIATIVGLSGIGLAYLIYYKKTISAEKIGHTFRPVYTLLFNKYYFDEIYQKLIIDPIMAFARFMWTFDARVIDGAVNGTAWATILWSDIKEWFDTWIVDGAVNGAGWLVQQWSHLLRFIQTGNVQFYALFIAMFAVLFGLTKVEFASPTYAWPKMTVIFLAGLLLLALVSRAITAREKARQNNREENR